MLKKLAKVALLAGFILTFYVSGVHASQKNLKQSWEPCVWDEQFRQCDDPTGDCGALGGFCDIFTPGHCICD